SPIIFGDGMQTRDFTYVQDVVEANFLAATKKSAVGQVFNIGFGSQTTIIELTQKILELCDKTHLEILFQSPRPGDVLHSRADITRAKDLLDFNPKFDLHNGLIKTIKWFQQ
ncbi:MAG: GDP-mannose 4,6-dehydratase, partial [Candidatus Helarchaeota archaeon]|nr:GDP-mannose 4,6-dehydratase [Candidatus Helarchaeota archaeon]